MKINNTIRSTWPKTRKQRNNANWMWVRERNPIMEEVKWVRIEDLVGVELPQPVVLVTGAFDLLHAPHMRLLFNAREKAGHTGTVLVAMNSDESVRQRKGPGRPIMTYAERAAVLNYMPIDYLIEFTTEQDLKTLADLAKVNCQIAGSEYFNKPTTAGVPVICIRDGGPHTTDIIERCQRKIVEDKNAST